MTAVDDRTGPAPALTPVERRLVAAVALGHQPWRALLFLAAILATAVTLSVVVGGRHGGLANTATKAACSTVEQVGVGPDLGTPPIKTGARDRCQPTATAAGEALAVAGWLLRLLAWTFATLFIAGFVHRRLHECRPQDLTDLPSY